jgi:uncharacterized membrane protein
MTAVPTPAAPDEPRELRAEFSGVLRVGVAVSGIVLFAGLLLAAVQGSVGLAARTGALPFGRYFMDLMAGQPWTLLWLGVVVLAVTPVVRVVLALGNFASARDRDYVALTAFVLFILLASIVLGVAA